MLNALLPSSALLRRLFGGALFAVPTALAAYAGDLWFASFMVVLMALSAHELFKLISAAGYHASFGVTLLAMLSVFAGLRFPQVPMLLPALSLVMLGTLAGHLRYAQTRRIGDWAIAFSCGLYLGWTGGHLAELRELPNGLSWLAVAIGCTWAADSGAYLAGRIFGRHKLAPTISPNKTWEGYFGGLFSAAGIGAAIGAYTPLGWLSGLLAGALVGGLSVLGDLIESMLKREAGAKDSGHLIPGHGGVLDRIDSLLWSGVLVFYVAQYAALLLRPFG